MMYLNRFFFFFIKQCSNIVWIKRVHIHVTKVNLVRIKSSFRYQNVFTFVLILFFFCFKFLLPDKFIIFLYLYIVFIFINFEIFQLFVDGEIRKNFHKYDFVFLSLKTHFFNFHSMQAFTNFKIIYALSV